MLDHFLRHLEIGDDAVAQRPDRVNAPLNRVLGVPHNVACPSALIGASNFFELAVAAAIALFGFQSGAVLATVVGVLVEVPVMLSVVRIVLRTRAWYERRDQAFTA
jgi:ACR3 family arsenite efflux pump ArsB